MDYKIKISIIIPVYNVAKYLSKCLESLSNQTLKDIEILCVDDHSTDNSLEILNDFASKDSRIKIINLENNQGQGFARNKALEEAKGEFIGFVDSDDYVDLNYFEELYNSAKQASVDIAVASILKHKKHYRKYNVYYAKKLKATTIQDKIKLCGDTKQFFFYAWNKIYKTEFLRKNNIKFAQGQIYEDVIFAIKALFYSDSVISVPNTNYNYIQHNNSTVKHKDSSGKKVRDLIKAYTELQDFCKTNEIKLPERLNYYSSEWKNPFIKTYIGKYYTKDTLFGIIQIHKRESINEFL